MNARLLAAPVVVAVLAGGFYVISRNAPTGGLAAIAAGAAWVGSATAVLAWLARRDRRALSMVLGAALVTVLVGGYLIRPQAKMVDEEIVSGEPVAAAAPAATRATPRRPSATSVKRATTRKPTNAARRSTTRKPTSAARRSTTRKPTSATKRAAPRKRAATAAPTRTPEPAEGSRPSAAPRNVEVLSGTFSGESGHRGQGRVAVVELAGGGRKLTFSEFDVDAGAGGLRVYLVAGEPAGDGEVEDFIDLAPLKGTTGDQQYDVPSDVDLGRYSTVVVWCVPFTTRIAQATLG
jgi:hypothetical protein